MKEWLTSMVAASVISSVSLLLTPAGQVRSVTKMACGVLCALAMVSPLLKLDMEKLAVSIAAYEQAAQTVVQNGEEESKMLERTYIEEQCAAYILSKATETGEAVGQIRVSARWDEDALLWYPWSAELQGTYSAVLSRILEAELGIPPERQSWTGEEGP